jgi:hypothetical protein
MVLKLFQNKRKIYSVGHNTLPDKFTVREHEKMEGLPRFQPGREPCRMWYFLYHF